MAKINLDEIIKKCEQGQCKDIAQSGNAKCFGVNDDYVLVIHKNSKFAERFANLSRELGNDMKCIYTVVDYRVVGDKVYELQRRARGEHFRIDHTKQDTLDLIQSIRKTMDIQIKKAKEKNSFMSIEGIKTVYEEQLNKHENYTKTAEYEGLVDSRKDDLLRRYRLLMQMPDQHITDFLKSVLILHDHKIEYDSAGNNVLYDKENGFAIIDLDDCSHRQGFKGNINTMLNADNCQTIKVLLGVKQFNRILEEDKPEVMAMMRQALKRICVATFDFEHNGKRMTREIMEQSLSTYRQYGIDITYDEIVQDVEKDKRVKSVQELGKETIQVQQETSYIDNTQQSIHSQEKMIEQRKEENFKI